MNVLQPPEAEVPGRGDAGVGGPLWAEVIARPVGLAGPGDLGKGFGQLSETALVLTERGFRGLVGRRGTVSRWAGMFVHMSHAVVLWRGRRSLPEPLRAVEDRGLRVNRCLVIQPLTLMFDKMPCRINTACSPTQSSSTPHDL